MRPALVLWDWNGTLLDDVALCVDALNHLLHEYGYPQQYDTASYRAIFGFPIRDYYERAGFDFSRHSFDVLAKSYMEYYIPAARACPLMPGAQTALTAVNSAEIPQVILSASPLSTLEAQVGERGIRHRFSALLGLQDIYAHSKVELGRQFLDSLVPRGILPQQCVMVGDSTHDFEVARALGTACVLFSGGHQPRAALEQTNAPVCDSLSEVSRLLLAQS